MMKFPIAILFLFTVVGCAATSPPQWHDARWYDFRLSSSIALESIASVGDNVEIYTRDKPTKIIQMRILDVKEGSITGNNLYITNGPQPEGVSMTIDRSNMLKIVIYEEDDSDSTSAGTSGAETSGAENSVGETATNVGKAAFTAGAILLCTIVIVGEIVDGHHNPNC